MRHFLAVLDELNRPNIEFITFREQIDTGGPSGRAVIVIIGILADITLSSPGSAICVYSPFLT